MCLFNSQWGLWNNGSGFGCKTRADIKAPEAWQIEKGDTSLTVAIVDDGIDRSLWELENRVWVNLAERNGLPHADDDHNGYVDDSIGWNFITNTPFVQPTTPELHGTSLAGIIGSETDSTNNCEKIAGVNWKCRLMNLKVDACIWSEHHDTCYIVFPTIAVAPAIYYASNMGAKVINLSFGYPVQYKAMPESLRTIEYALIYAYQRSVVSVAAIGNGDTNKIGTVVPLYPGTSSRTLGVGATTCSDNRVTPSSYWTWESSYSINIDLVAPGVNIFTGLELPYRISGTSASTAIVSGIASLVITHRRKLVPTGVLTAEQIYEVIRHTADDTVGHTYTSENPPQLEDQPCFDSYYGWGRANAFKALVAVSHGDANNDSRINLADVNYLVNYLFKGGPQPVPTLDMGDSNCDKGITLADVVYLVSYLYKGGPPPSLCYTDCSQP